MARFVIFTANGIQTVTRAKLAARAVSTGVQCSEYSTLNEHDKTICSGTSGSLPEKAQVAIHITDTPQETLILAQALLLSNSLRFLRNVWKIPPAYVLETMANVYAWARENKIPEGDICVDSSVVLHMHGIRKSNDLDLVIRGYDGESIQTKQGEIGVHNTNYKSSLIDELMDNPELHFFYGGVKFASLEEVRRVKLERARQEDAQLGLHYTCPDDMADIDLIDDFMTGRTGGQSHLWPEEHR